MANKRPRYTTVTRTKKTVKYQRKNRYKRTAYKKGRTYKKPIGKGFKTKKIVRRFPKKKRIIKLNRRVRNLERKVLNTTSHHHDITVFDKKILAPANHCEYGQIEINNLTYLRNVLTQLPQRNTPVPALTDIIPLNNPDGIIRLRTASTTTMKNPGLTALRVRMYVMVPKLGTSTSPVETLRDESTWEGSYAWQYDIPYEDTTDRFSRHFYPTENPILKENWKVESTKDYYIPSGRTRRVFYNRKLNLKSGDLRSPGGDWDNHLYEADHGTAMLVFRVVGVLGVDVNAGVIANFDTIESQLMLEHEMHTFVTWEGGTVPVRTKQVRLYTGSETDTKLATEGQVPVEDRIHTGLVA